MPEKYQLALFIGAMAACAIGVFLWGERWTLKNRLADAQERLERWERAWQEHDKWLALSSPEAELVLRNLKAQVKGEALDVCWPPSKSGPWEISRLREVLNTRRQTWTDEAQRRREAEQYRALTQTIVDRDRYCEWADKLAEAIGAHFGIEIGEHSAGFEANNPWANALEWIENAPSPGGVQEVPDGK